jgi:RNA polymerase sigma-70 factor (ECF subfamily)
MGDLDEPEGRSRCLSAPRLEVSYEILEAVEHNVVAAAGASAVTVGSSAVDVARRGRANRRPGVIMDPDAELVDRWLGGDEVAFEALVRRHERRVFGLVLRMLGDREEAQDVAQEAFLSLHRHGHRFRREARFSTFVYRVAANAALNRRRSLGRKRAREQALAQRQEAGIDLPAHPRDPEDAAAGSEIQVQVQEALLELPPDLRAAIVLYDIEGQSYGDISEALGIPEGTVKSRIHRARNTLRQRLADLARASTGGKAS